MSANPDIRLQDLEARIAAIEVTQRPQRRPEGGIDAALGALRGVAPEMGEDLSRPFAELGLDSFDLVELRVALESATGLWPTDAEWTLCETPSDVLALFSGGAASDHGVQGTEGSTIVVNMPQMVLGGLSESWVFKELGDRHWRAICDALGTASHQIADSFGNRLYATFVRIWWRSERSLFEFRENERLHHSSSLSRHGGSMFFSNAKLSGAGADLRANLMTSFAIRRNGNRSLARGEPSIPDGAVTLEPELPRFAAEYRAMRRGERSAISLHRVDLKVRGVAEASWSSVRELNPYADINGVELLYFAAYPTIADLAERTWMSSVTPLRLKGDYALSAATVERDIYYYANCEIDDTVTYHLLDWATDGDEIATLAALTRGTDDVLMAHVATRRRLRV